MVGAGGCSWPLVRRNKQQPCGMYFAISPILKLETAMNNQVSRKHGQYIPPLDAAPALLRVALKTGTQVGVASAQGVLCATADGLRAYCEGPTRTSAQIGASRGFGRAPPVSHATRVFINPNRRLRRCSSVRPAKPLQGKSLSLTRHLSWQTVMSNPPPMTAISHT